jgi:hypothetical protein
LEKRCASKLNSANNPDVLASQIVGEYLYYASDMREYSDRLKNIVCTMINETGFLNATRRKEFDKEWMKTLENLLLTLKKDLNNHRKKLRKLKGYKLKQA